MDRHSIHGLVSVSVQSLNHSALHLNGLIRYHVNVSVVIDQTNVHIQIKYSMKNYANVNAQRYLSAPVDRDLIHKHVNASVLSQNHSALMLRNLMTLHASVSAQIAQQDVPILRFLIMIHANATVPKSLDALVGKDLIQIHVNVSALDQSLHVLMLKNLTILHANVSAQINQSTVPILRYLTMIHARVDVPVYSDALVDKNLIQIHVNVSALDQSLRVLMLKNLITSHASVSAQINQIDVPTPKYLIIILANVAALISSDALVGKSLIQTLANVSVLNQGQSALMLRNLMM